MASASTSGSAASFADVQTAIINFLVTHGWTDQSANAAGTRILSKGGLFVWIGNTAVSLSFYPGTGRDGSGNLTGRPSNVLGSGNWDGVKMESPAPAPIVFPINYEIIWHDDPQEEVYVVISYGGDKYQHAHWGKTDIAGVGGTGMWMSGSVRTDVNLNGDTNYGKMFLQTQNYDNGNSYFIVTPYSGFSGGYFSEGTGYSYMASFLNHNLETVNGAGGYWNQWGYPQTSYVGGLRQGQDASTAIVNAALPSSFNEAEVLMPVTTYVNRSSSLITLGVSLRHCRRLRIDNVAPGQIITYGGDQWKCFPLYAKNVAQRDGVGWSTGANHSGTFGIAIRMPEA